MAPYLIISLREGVLKGECLAGNICVFLVLLTLYSEAALSLVGVFVKSGTALPKTHSAFAISSLFWW